MNNGILHETTPQQERIYTVYDGDFNHLGEYHRPPD